MKIDAYNEQKKAAMLYDTRSQATDTAGNSVSGVALTEAVAFTRGDKDFELFGASGYADEEVSLKQRAKSCEEIADEAQSLLDNMKAITNKMDMGEIVTMDEEGVDVNDTEVERIVTVGEQIRIKLAAAGNEHVYTGDIDDADAEAVLGSSGAALIAEALNRYNYPVTPENVAEVEETLREAENLKLPDVQAVSYLMNNGLVPTVENMYKAEFAAGGGSRGQQLSDEQWGALMPQIESMLEQAGLNADEESLADIRELIECGTAITPDTLAIYEEITQAAELISGISSEDTDTAGMYKEVLIDKIAAHMADGEAAVEVNLSDEPVTWQKADEVIQILDSVTIDTLTEFLEGGEYEMTLLGLVAANEAAEYTPGDIEPNPLDYYNIPEERLGNADSIRTLRRLEELRLMMTFESAYIMEKNGIDVFREDLSKLVEELKKLEITQATIYHGQEMGTAPERTRNMEDISDIPDYRRTMYDIGRLKYAPCDAIGLVADAGQVSLAELERTAFEQQRAYEEAGKAYETMATQIRPDLGDRISAAVEAGTDYVIKEFDLEDTVENRRAVRILAYNRMEVTVLRLERVKEIDKAVNNLFKKMTPDIAFDMLKDGTDIMNMKLEELLEDVERRGMEKERTNTQKFSEFLYEMDKKGAVTVDEREQYMALYTIVNKLIKDKSNAVGQLVNQDGEATLGNLVTAYMTRQDAGINVEINEQGSRQGLRQQEHNNAKLAYYKELLSKVSELPKEAVELVTENEIPHTVNNLAAAGAVYADNAYLYKEIKKAGIEADLNRFFDDMDNRELLNENYTKVEEELKAALAKAMKEGNPPDIQLFKQLGSAMSVLSSMARHNTFYLPYETQKGTGAIKLSLVENTEASGSFSIDMDSDEYGHISVSAKIEDDSLTAYILQENENGEALQAVEDELKAMGFSSVRLTFARTQQFLAIGKGVCKKTETRKIFAAAKVFVERFR